MRSPKQRVFASAMKHFEQWFRPVTGLILLAALFTGFLLLGLDTHPRQPVVEQAEWGWYAIYFSQPGDPDSTRLRGGPDQALARAIADARYSVDMAVMHLDLWSLRDALIEADRRGVRIRLVVDDHYIDEPEVQALIDLGIPVLADRRGSLMHHKFTIIDHMDVWTGSMNYTVNGAYRNDNNLIHLRSYKLAQSYSREFEEMFKDRNFGALSEADTPFPRVNLNGMEVEVYFSPDDEVAERLQSLIAMAEERIDFLAFVFTSDPIAQALIAQESDGVMVRGVIERGQANNSGSEVGRLLLAGVDLRLDANQNKMHHKVIVIDGEIVVTGSYNFSRNAEEDNDENVVILHSEEIARHYLIEFERIYMAAGK